ncbi:SDR family oxidoreductase [Microbacterium sp. NPDC076895]|uniref:SDR family oxidoreductase n=1 Tax=Microbacterium sp. NPDC076895 TaxID=3154957 RepID=UPI0034133179
MTRSQSQCGVSPAQARSAHVRPPTLSRASSCFRSWRSPCRSTLTVAPSALGSGVSVPADMIHYGVTKAAMIALGNVLAKRTRGTAVTVNTVLGGPTYSDGVAEAIEQIARTQGAPVDAVKDAVIGQNATTLLERFIEPTEIASLVTYLASPLASATNGAALRADGGVLTTIV